MPCNCDYMDPTRDEQNSRDTAKCLVYTLEFKGKHVPAEYKKAASDMYGNTSILNEMVVHLCFELRELEKTDIELFDKLVYNGRERKSRDLAVWWEEHVKADQLRITAAAELEKHNRLIESVKNKLTKEELEAIGL